MQKGTDQAAPADAPLAPIVADPSMTAILLDLDGTLAPIVARPEDAVLDSAARELLATIAATYALTAIVTGRRADAARAIVGIDEIAYAGIHGYELLAAGAESAVPAEALEGHADDAPAFARELDANEIEAVGVSVEHKGPIVAFHWRRAADQELAEGRLRRLAAAATGAGLHTHFGRKVLEIRPPVIIDKGAAVAGLLDGSDARRALYAGDDRTDLDAFAELVRRREAGDLEAIVRVGVRSEEGPAEIVEQADLVVDGPGRMRALLEALSG